MLRPLILLIVCVALFLVNSMCARLMVATGSDFFGLSLAALILAQAAVHSIGMVLLDARLMQRFLAAVITLPAVLMGWLCGLTVGLAIESREVGEAFKVVVAIICSLPALLLAFEFPLWLVRFFGGWRIASSRLPGPSPVELPWGIKHLLGATAAIAIALTLPRFGGEDVAGTDLVVELIIPLLILALFSAANVLPTVVCVLRANKAGIGILLGLVVQLVCLVPVLALANLLGAPPKVFGLICALFTVYAATFLLTLGVLHTFGFRLYRGKERFDQASDIRPRRIDAALHELAATDAGFLPASPKQDIFK